MIASKRAVRCCLLIRKERKQCASNHDKHDNVLRTILPVRPMRYSLRRHDGHCECVDNARPCRISDHEAMLTWLPNSQQQADTKAQPGAQVGPFTLPE